MSVTGILGKKIGMTQIFDDRGDVHPVTVLKAGPCVITQLKTLAKDGYDAAQIGYVDFIKASKVNKAMTGHFAKSNVPPVRMMKEVPVEVAKEGDEAAVKAGDRVMVDIFTDEKFVDVIGTSKGRGFAGVVRRHDLAAAPRRTATCSRCRARSAHRRSRRASSPASVCPATWATRRSRSATCASAAIDLEDNLLLVEGAVPGPRDGYVLISKAKAPPRERRGFAGAATKDALKASKKAAPQEEVVRQGLGTRG